MTIISQVANIMYIVFLLHSGLRIGNNMVFIMDKIYGRLLVIYTKRAISLDILFGYELAAMHATFTF